MNSPMYREIKEFLKRHFTPAVLAILLINVGIMLFSSVFLVILGPIVKINLSEWFMLFLAQIPQMAVGCFQVWRFVTYMFLHAGGMHLIFNMVALYFFARRLEQVWGTKRFLLFYFVCGIGAAIVHAIFTYLFYPNSMQIMIGASGAVYGVLLAYALNWPEQRVYLYLLFPIKIKYLIIIIIFIEFIGTVGAPMGQISHITHLGGLLTAFIYLRGWKVFLKGRGGGFFRCKKRYVKRFYRDEDGRIYIKYEDE